MTILWKTIILFSSVPPRKKEGKGAIEGPWRDGGNDFEIFVAVHKFEGGGYAYLNTEPNLLPYVQLFLVVVFFLFLFFFFFAATARAAALLDLTSSLVSFLVFLLQPPLLLFGS